ncbi:hypothetical protein M0R45_019351 [Rubus argutus]|uniref:Uncharacterized protein n=1 Tax=Rubus argutus TaxID=59490 RepID=A0AAW1X536_RUBAR
MAREESSGGGGATMAGQVQPETAVTSRERICGGGRGSGEQRSSDVDQRWLGQGAGCSVEVAWSKWVELGLLVNCELQGWPWGNGGNE